MFNLKKTLELQEQTEKEYDEQIHKLQLRIKELEDWNEDYQGLLLHYSFKTNQFL